jgi:hypothetical protein
MLPIMNRVVGIVGWIVFAVAGCDRPGEEQPRGEARPGGELLPVEEPAEVSLVPADGMGQWVSIDFGGEGEVGWEDGVLHLGEGSELTGARWDGALPPRPYEVQLEARKTLGDDFFCGLTVPVRDPDTCVTLVVGGWGGGVVGISSIDGFDASENETTDYRAFYTDQWYSIRVRVTDESIEAWIDGDQVVEVDTDGKELGLRSGAIDLCAPFGLAAWQTRAEIRNLSWRPSP